MLLSYFRVINQLTLIRLCGEGDLFDKIQSVGFFNEYEAAYLMKQILSSVNYCHFSNIVHRDIKADNFLIETSEKIKHTDEKFYNLYNLRLTDFSSARSFKKSKKLTKKVGTVIKIHNIPLTYSLTTLHLKYLKDPTMKNVTYGAAGFSSSFCYAESLRSLEKQTKK